MRKLLLIFMFMYVFSCSSRIAAVSSGKDEHGNETNMKQTTSLGHGSVGGGKSPVVEGGNNGAGSGSSQPEGGRVIPLYAAGAANNQRQRSHNNASNNPRPSTIETTLITVCTMSFIFIVI